MSRAVIWSQDALSDLDQIVAHFSDEDPDQGDRLIDRIEQTGNRLSEFAIGHPGRVTGTYEKLVARTAYVIVYRLVSDPPRELVAIARVIHASRDGPDEDWPV